MAVKVKTSGKIVMILLVLGGLFAAKTFWWDKRPQEATGCKRSFDKNPEKYLSRGEHTHQH